MIFKNHLGLLFLFIGLTTQAQTVRFTYDASGNRTQRVAGTIDVKPVLLLLNGKCKSL